MTYTFKLARRLALCHLAWPAVVAVVGSACSAGEPTAPTSGTIDPLVAVQVTPKTPTIETNQTIRFYGKGVDAAGDSMAIAIEWAATGGTITADGVFAARSTGHFHVIGKGKGRNKADTSTVTVVPPQPTLTAIVVTPAADTLAEGASVTFTAAGRLSDGSTAPIGAVWSATGGTIDAGGRYTAGTSPGQHRVVATNTSGTVADTVPVSITAPQLAQVVLVPATTTVAPGGAQQFTAYGRTSAGDSIATPVSFSVTGGTVSTGGLYTAGQTTGTYRVIATSTTASKADTSAVTIQAAALAQLILVPAVATVAAGGTVQFSVYGRTTAGDSVAAQAAYIATGGTITQNGLYTAGGAPGAYRVLAVLAGGSLADTSTVTAVPASPEIAISPGTQIQQIVNQNPAGTHFLLKTGVHTQQAVTPKDSMEFRGEPGTVMNGQGVTRFAFEGNAVAVRIRDLEITGYSPAISSSLILGAIQGYEARDWILSNLNVHHNSGDGANLRGHFTVLGGTFHHNGQMGIAVFQGAGGLVDGVDLSFNNPDTLFAPLVAAGGIKIEASDDVTVRGCHVHDNVGPGIWYDGDNRGSLVSNNLVTDNTHLGILYEISLSGVIQGNTLLRNGAVHKGVYGAGIVVSASRDVEVYQNVLQGNDQGIIGLQEDRGSGQFGPYLIQNLWVHDNNVSLLIGTSGLLNFMADATLYTRNNRFDRNIYAITGNPLPFWIDGLTRVSRSAWQARGFDQNSTFTGP